MKLEFPKDFKWGSATSSHQVEGNNYNDWSIWEKENALRLSKESKQFPPENYISGQACDHYNRFREDFDIAQSLGHNAHRFSIEWSRIEPEQGKFNEKEIEHYQEVIDALRQRGLEPFVTLWHWTNPVWFAKKGGWLNKDAPKYFERYVDKIVRSLKNVKFWITLNEPEDIFTLQAYLVGTFPAKKKSIIKTLYVLKNLRKVHEKAYKVIHDSNSGAMVGFVNNMRYFEARGLFTNKIKKCLASYFWNFWLTRKTINYNDFLGCNYYTVKRYGGKRKFVKEISDMGWQIYPEGIYHVLKDLKKYNLPIYITENGLADAKDERRAKFIKDHLYWVHKAIREDVDVRGYLHWSLLDNFEWDKGFWPRFGLVEVNYKTLERRIRPSAWIYKEIIEKGLPRA